MLDNPSPKQPTVAAGSYFHQELVAALLAHYRFLILGLILAALIGYLLAWVTPRGYTSWAYLRLDRAMARNFEAITTSPAVAGKVLEKYHDTVPATSERRVQFLQANTRLTDIDPGADRTVTRLVRFEVTNWNPRLAQSISADLIDAWLETARPGPSERANLTSELERTKAAAASYSALTDQLQKEARILVLPNTQAGEIASPIADLISKRDLLYARVMALQDKLTGVSRDVIVQAPHLPQQSDPPKRLAAGILSGMVALPLLLAVVLLGRFFAPNLTPRQAVFRLFGRTA